MFQGRRSKNLTAAKWDFSAAKLSGCRSERGSLAWPEKLAFPGAKPQFPFLIDTKTLIRCESAGKRRESLINELSVEWRSKRVLYTSVVNFGKFEHKAAKRWWHWQWDELMMLYLMKWHFAIAVRLFHSVVRRRAVIRWWLGLSFVRFLALTIKVN